VTLYESRLGELDALLADGTRFGTIEDWIEDQPIDGDSKAALWLAAWSEQPRRQRRAMVAPGGARGSVARRSTGTGKGTSLWNRKVFQPSAED
jgi:hypothetical protein